MSYPPSGEGQPPGYDPNQPPLSSPASGAPYSDPYGMQPGTPPPPGQQPGYQSPAYPQQPVYPGAGYPPQPSYPVPPSSSTNVMAILSLVMAFVFSPVAIVLGHIAKKQIRETGEQGDGLATAGLVLGYIFTGLYLLLCCGYIVIMAVAASSASNTSSF